MGTIREGWQNAFYRATACYVATLVTLIFVLLTYRVFVDLPSEDVCQKCCETASRIINEQE